MGSFYDKLIVKHLPEGSALESYATAPENSAPAMALANAKNLAGPEVLQATLIIPIVLIVAFGGLVLYMRSRNKQTEAAPIAEVIN
jgi:hypothetical protein